MSRSSSSLAIVVIGAGLGGLAAAIRLARRGHRVSIFEKNDRPGGKLNTWSSGGFTFDTGPSLLTMPFVLRDLLEAGGRSFEDCLEIVPVDPLCRYRFSDGTILDATTDVRGMVDSLRRIHPGDADRYPDYLAHARRIYDHASGPFLFSPILPLTPAKILHTLPLLPSAFRIDAFRTLHEASASYFAHPYTQQLLDRFATYNGSSPYKAPATLALISHIELSSGGWYVRGGMYTIAKVLEDTALAAGVNIRYGSEVRQIQTEGNRARGVVTVEGQQFPADVVICNADVLFAEQALFRKPDIRLLKRAHRAGVSLAGYVMLLGVSGEYPQLSHHNVFFTSDYCTEFATLFDRGVPYEDPTVYVAVSCRTDPQHAPTGHLNLFVLVNAPPVDGRFDWDRHGGSYRETVLNALERHGVEGLRDRIVVEKVIAPPQFAAAYNAYQGSIYGMSSNSRFSAFLRPSNRSSRHTNVFYVGGSTHPGGGIPLVLLSGRIVADLIGRDHP